LLTAWIGIRDVGKPRREAVVVSAAVGAVGSAAGQLTEFDATRVVLTAGGPETVRCRSTGSASTRPSTTAPTTGEPAINPVGSLEPQRVIAPTC
jgi:NADPH:quinone reductase-like Zn-dependent oxidoreductase